MNRSELIASMQDLANDVLIDDQELIAKLIEIINNVSVTSSDNIPVSLTEAQAGVLTTIRSWSPQRVKDAIEALAWNARFSSPITAANIGTVGGFSNGDTVATIEEFARKLLVKLVAPSLSLNGSNQSVEVGASHTLNFSATFTQNDAGALSGIVLNRNGAQIDTSATSPLSYNENRTRTAPLTEVYQAIATYLANAANGFASGTVNSVSRTYSIIYPIFHGTSGTAVDAAAIKTAIEAAGGTKTVSNPSGNVTVNYNATARYLWYAEPATMTVKDEWEVTALNRGSIGGGSNLFATPVLINISSPTSLWSDVPYRVYFTNFATSINSNLTFQV